MKHCYLTISFLAISIAHGFTQDGADTNVVVIPKAQSRSFILTNNNSTFFFSETGSQNILSMQGLNVHTYEYLEDYILEADGKPLTREIADAFMYPNKVIRKYKDIDLEEEVSLMDSLPVLSIKLKTSKKIPITLIPIMSSNESSKYAPLWSIEEKILFVSQQEQSENKENHPVWTGICTFPLSEFSDSNNELKKTHVKYIKQQEFLPGRLTFYLDGLANIFIIVGENKNDILNKRKQVLKRFNIYLEKTEQKIEGVRRT